MEGRRLHVITWFCVGLLGPVLLCGISLLTYGLLSNDDEQITADSPDNVAPTALPSQSDESSEPKTPRPKDLKSLDTFTDDYTRAVALRTLLSSADQQHVISLLEQAKAIRPDDRRLSTQIEIFRRFAVINPVTAMQHTFDIAWNRRAPIVNAIFLEWATADVDTAIAHSKTLGSADQRTALGAILRIRDDFSEDRIQELALEFGHESIGGDVLEQVQIYSAFNDPESAWNALLEDAQPDNFQISSLATVLELWVAREGFDVVFEAMDSIPEMDSPMGILDPILTPIAKDDPRRAFELVNEFKENARKAAAFLVVGEWAETDPATAFDTVSEFDIRPTYIKENLLQNIGFAWAENAPYEAFPNLSKYLSGFTLQWIQGNALKQIVRKSPADAVDLLNSVPNGVEELGGALVEEWATSDTRAALNWIGLQEESLHPALLQSVMPALVEKDPDLALSTALNQSIAEGQLGLEYEVIRILARTDVHRATEMLPHVRDHEDTKKRAYSELGRALANKYDSTAAIELGSELPESFQDDYFREIINAIYNTDRVELSEILDLLPKPKYQQEAARYLIWDTGFGADAHRYFTDEQLEEIRTFE
ncbi:MAG: hypothetical protein F4X56_07690 [Gammaproteobacteria bacterium]|nr:hypothetical protein [Gammaproteobacteria bacterium]MYC25783.1 hypothetical protein [Gammaproteobacteria bacterium]